MLKPRGGGGGGGVRGGFVPRGGRGSPRGGYYSPRFRGRGGRGMMRGRGGMRGGRGGFATSVDRRPTMILVSGYEAEERDEVFAMFQVCCF